MINNYFITNLKYEKLPLLLGSIMVQNKVKNLNKLRLSDSFCLLFKHILKSLKQRGHELKNTL
jgi:hypothetical protein